MCHQKKFRSSFIYLNSTFENSIQQDKLKRTFQADFPILDLSYNILYIQNKLETFAFLINEFAGTSYSWEGSSLASLTMSIKDI